MTKIRENKCTVCKKHYNFKDKRVSCTKNKCNKWIHVECLRKKFKNSANEIWSCKDHINVVNSSSSSSILSKDSIMTLKEEKIGESSKAKSCVKCNNVISDNSFKACVSCENLFHNTCLSAIEVKSFMPEDEKIICEGCMLEISKVSYHKKGKNMKMKRQNDSDSEIDSESDDNEDDSENEVEKDEQDKDPYKFVTVRKDRENKNNNGHNDNNIQNDSMPGDVVDYFKKLSFRKLPLVVDSDLSWSIFYEAFVKTKSYFTDLENITRLQDAIQDERVKKIGGKNLFNSKTYEACLKDINRRLKYNFNAIYKEASEIENQSPIKSFQKAKIVEFIDKLRNFDMLAKAYNETSYLHSKKFLANIANVLPMYLKTAWEKKQSKLEQKHKEVTLSTLVKVLVKFIPELELSMRNDAFTGNNKKDGNEREKKRFEKPRLYHTDFNSEKPVNKKLAFRCWLHNSDDHKFNNCSELWKLDGREVSKIARRRGICTYCGEVWSDHQNCPSKNKLKCRTEGCNFPHHSLFCFKRNPNKEHDKRENKIKNNNTLTRELYPSKRKDEANHERQSTSRKDTDDELEEFVKEMTNCNFSSMNVNVVENSNISYNSFSCGNVTSSINTLGVIVVKLNESKQIALLVDSGSSVSLIEQSVVDELNVRGPKFPITLRWSGNHQRKDESSEVVKLEAENVTNKKKFHMFFRTVRDLKICPQKFVAMEFYERFKYLSPLSLNDYEKIHGIVGIDNIFVFHIMKIFKSKCESSEFPIGIRCPLGDYVMGSFRPLEKIYYDLIKDQQQKNNMNIGPNYNSNNNYELTESEQKELKIMELEAMGLEYFMPDESNARCVAEDEYALKKLKESTFKISNSSHYVAPILWKDDNIKLESAESYKVALRRFLIVEKQSLKLNKFDECADQVANLIKKGYAKEMSEEESKVMSDKTFYNPIFFIYPHNKRSRMIWDCAAKVNGKSLNDFIVTGPNLYNSLVEILMQMRERKFVFKGDLQEMFHQIFVSEQDSDSLRFLFRFSSNEKIKTFKMLVLPFGLKCSPTVSQYIKNLVALSYSTRYKDACDIILHNSYVDDIIKSVDKLRDAKLLPLKIKYILSAGGFNLLKINSNSSEITKFVKSHLEKYKIDDEKVLLNDSIEKILGYDVDFIEDKIMFNNNVDKFPTNIFSGNESPSKRQILQVMMSFYDPLGYGQFFTSKLKILYHRLCADKYEWDQLLNDEHKMMWDQCKSWLSQMFTVKIPRIYCLEYSNAKTIQLWAFGDSGKEIACGALYLRFLDHENRQLGYSLIYAKSFITPLKQNRTIPELELNIAKNISVMVEEVLKMLTLKVDKIIYATDNAAVNEWITNEPHKPTVYVKNRVDKINSLSKKEDWIWIPSEFMVADFGTKFTSMPEIKFENDWFHPRLFAIPESNWPKFEANKNDVAYQMNLHQAKRPENDYDEELVKQDPFHPSKFNRYLSLIYSIQIAFRWLHLTRNEKAKTKINEMKKTLKHDIHNRSLKEEIKKFENDYNERRQMIFSTTFKFDQAESLCIAKAQKSEYNVEINLLKQQKPIPKSSKIYHLSPFLDHKDIIRINTRISINPENCEKFGYDRIAPILLPKNNSLTALIILKYHSDNKHIFHTSVVINLTKRFYIPKIKSIVKYIINEKCILCRKNKFKPEIPMMGDLPAVRLAHHIPPFTNVMVDLAGPVVVNVHRNVTDKRYILVYTCLSTRGVHLELMQRMDTESTIAAIISTISIRGAPNIILSDNALNFKGAQNVFKEAHEKCSKVMLEKGIISSPIDWQFGPPRSPHFQGAVERMVGLTKEVLKKLILISEYRHKLLNDFLLRTMLNEVIGILNNRPLTVIPIEGTQNEFLTPNFFLNGRQGIQILPATQDSNFKKSLYESYEDIKIITNLLWSHWIKAYLPTILLREKWIDRKTPLNIGDVVMTLDTQIANSWRIGKIVEIHSGSKNQVREYTVLLGKNNQFPRIEKMTRNEILKLYQDEKYSIVKRSAISVAKINLEAIKI